MGKSLGEDLMAEVLRVLSQSNTATCLIQQPSSLPFVAGSYWTTGPRRLPDFPDPHSEGSTQILIMDTVEGPNRAC